ncbi:hypothetical protein VOLCADRAFT_108574 [Volvox carteri f. nagariensis]|uniref:Uncharacterized protein n=1 Tax=Volvox carteri f. nagariensis TaxID=3068 RepID=D8UL16_VOLCA|nr:uncharacterized protein VOLCADRAFT_108574 [Volvox carteri f. nagariensis]EFJ39582.1 hypothetical protein VOLCADRAFT_108574 [Volvox carteri f. nagariensis]|eukprot:XP_002959354.1 hypothetical protein VOLCADRAFT_108574 [Volvox carteri f. nagariensis]
MASSPRNSNYNEQAGLRLWMGPWSYVELEAARGIMFSSVSKAKLSELYARWGGIPRYVLKYAANPELQEELDAAVATVNMDLLWKSVGNIEAAPDVSHKLIHVEVRSGEFPPPSNSHQCNTRQRVLSWEMPGELIPLYSRCPMCCDW